MKWKNTKFKKFLDKAGSVITNKGGDVVDIALKAATGDFAGAINEVGDLLGRDKDFDEESNALFQEFQLKMKEFEIEQAKIEAEDRDSARRMQETALKSGDTFSKRFIYYLAGFWSFVGALFVFLVFFVTIPEKNIRLVDTLEGFVLGNIVAGIIAFFFGGINKGDD